MSTVGPSVRRSPHIVICFTFRRLIIFIIMTVIITYNNIETYYVIRCLFASILPTGRPIHCARHVVTMGRPMAGAV